MMTTLRYCAFLLLAASLTSCHRNGTITYRMKNIASDSIMVICGNQPLTRYDTFWIGYNQTTTLLVAGKGKDHISNYRVTSPSLTDFSSIQVLKLHSFMPPGAGFMQAAYWTYEEKGRSAAWYTATVTDASF